MISAKYRRLLLGLIIVGLAPSVWLSEGEPEQDLTPRLSYERLEVQQSNIGNGVSIVSAFELSSPNSHFGSYSALALLPNNMLFTASDQGAYLRFSTAKLLRAKQQEEGEIPSPKFARLAGEEETDKTLVDIEAITADHGRGLLWFAYEGTNVIERRRSDLNGAKRVEPAAISDFSSNSGPEAMVRLKNGRFILLSEGHDSSVPTHPAVYFDSDPVGGAVGVPFLFQPIPEYRPVDMAQLPDGRVLILHRRVIPGFIPSLASKIMIADPAEIAAGQTWYGKELAAIASPNPSDNYEGIAVYMRKDGAIGIWLITDDNQSRFQRTLLLNLRWEVPDAPKPTMKKQSAQ